jgi:uncharacterized damage-inducible protein DinB
MTRTARILQQLVITFDGEPWYGTSVRRMMHALDESRVHERPIAESLTPAELLAHLTVWIENVTRRLHGESFEITHDIDFPSVDAVSWPEQLARLDRAHKALMEKVATLTDEDLDRKVPTRNHNAEFMLDGLIQHTAYHQAQIAILMK